MKAVILVLVSIHFSGPLVGQCTSHCQPNSTEVYSIPTVTIIRAVMKRGICFPLRYGTLASANHTISCEPSEYSSLVNDNEVMKELDKIDNVDADLLLFVP